MGKPSTGRKKKRREKGERNREGGPSVWFFQDSAVRTQISDRSNELTGEETDPRSCASVPTRGPWVACEGNGRSVFMPKSIRRKHGEAAGGDRDGIIGCVAELKHVLKVCGSTNEKPFGGGEAPS